MVAQILADNDLFLAGFCQAILVENTHSKSSSLLVGKRACQRKLYPPADPLSAMVPRAKPGQAYEGVQEWLICLQL
jgi:hypothetical protein